MKETNSSVGDNHKHLDIPRLFSSEAWKELTGKQAKLYLFCRWQRWTGDRPGADYPDMEEYQRPEVFYLNWKRFIVKDCMTPTGQDSITMWKHFADMDSSNAFLMERRTG